ncbi:MAG: AsmA family protein [Rhodospirillaceae bacterium]|nr:AsmA family protein [Rhodospirillaceae bacterium]
MRKFILILLGLIVVTLAGAVTVLLTLDFNQYKPEIEAEVEAITGRDVTIIGDVRVTFIPTLAIAIDDITIAGAPGASGLPFLELPEVLAAISLAPLASLEVVVERIRLIEPVIVLETQADGLASWQFEPVATSEPGSGAAPAVSIELIDVQDARIEWRDGDDRRTFDQVDLWIDALGADGPFEAQGEFLHGGRQWVLEADLGRISRPQLSINSTLRSGDDIAVKIAGTLATDSTPIAFSGQIEADIAKLDLLSKLAGVDALPASAGELALSLDTGFSVSSSTVRLSDLAVELGESQTTGSAFVTLDGARTIELALTASRLDLDTLLPALLAGEGQTPELEPVDTQLWPDDLTLKADLVADAVVFNASPIRQVHFTAVLDKGAWSISQAEALLPGGTSLALSGEVVVEEDEPVFRGPVEATSDNLRATLEWLEFDLEGVAQDRLRRVDLFADLFLSPGVIAMTGLDLGFDSSRLTGGIAARISEIPSVTAELVLDQINLDAYLPETVASDDAAEQSDESLAAVVTYISLINLDIDARVDVLTYNGVAVSGLVADGILLDDKLVLESFGAADIAGAAVRLSGTVDPVSGSVALQMGIKAEDAGGLLRLAGVNLPIDPAELGAVELVGDITGDAEQAVVRQRLQTALGAASVDGTWIDPFGTPSFDGRLGLRSTSYRILAAAFGIDLPDAADSEIAIATDIATDMDQAEFNAVIEVLGVKLRGSGAVEGLQSEPLFDVRLQVEHAELAGLLRDLGVDGGFPDLGPVDLGLTATGTPDLVDIVLAQSTIGPSSLRGTLGVTLSGERPYVQARLEADVLALDPFLAASSGGTLGDTRSQDNQRWSSEEIDLGFLELLDGRFELVAERLEAQNLVVEDPTVVASLEDGQLDIERLDGRLFDGQVALTGTVLSGVPHHMNLKLALADADMAWLMRHFADSDAVSGRLFLDVAVDGVGMSQRDFVQSLAGNGAISLRDGFVEGFDLRAISDRLGNLDNEVAIATMLAEASSGGQTAITAAEGNFVMTEGVARSQDLSVLLDGGRGDFVTAIDLPRWWIDLEGQARLTDHPNAPAIPVAVNGPIDNPERVVDTRSLENFLVQRVAETALRKLGEDELGGAAGALLGVITGSSGDSGTGQEASTQGSGSDSAPLEAVPAKPEAPETTQDAAGQVLDLLTGGSSAESAEEPASSNNQGSSGNQSSSGSLLDLLGGSSGNNDTEMSAPEKEQPASEDLNTEELLLDLLGGLAN